MRKRSLVCEEEWKEEKKSPPGCRASNSSGTAGGDLPYGGCYGLTVFEFLKLVVPGAFFAKDFGVALDLRAAGFSRLSIKDDILALQLAAYALLTYFPPDFWLFVDGRTGLRGIP